MRLASVRVGDREAAARVEGDTLVLLPFRDVGALLADPAWRELAAGDGEIVAGAQVRLLPVVPRPDKVVCLGRNYAEHVAETGNELPTHPVLFAKFRSSLTGPYDDVPMPSASELLDWEVELVVVIGTGGRDIAVEDALDHVAGYSVSNDLSVRDWQNRTKQWLAGKAWDGLTPVGPYLVTADDLPPGAAGLEISCEVDGVVMQRSTTDKMIFDVATTIADISVFTRLEPGDLILTGTPDGVGNARDPKIFLRPGQVVLSRVERVGETRNRIVAQV
ncbi:fumarylacetoacetate hydrolase family protein [Nocardioides sp. cx-173]|uniref:fumarylacetoacetate hydrolase family protein n=1 Tax=Nocardioides sp. cx-173 TaxID=2898796 RepID=UPI001E3E9921|nr:fumarylacetoacetate hydrolase family protein [Nocardioides sp. cx-173]MCD4526578.1 fumarylacetoacetate hydrolase family protein [Nocardioides sp. cx-173]UGB40673.1 fumarylacetoacetate hydrolase family protein [Nocardioides sp. cx-173]